MLLMAAPQGKQVALQWQKGVFASEEAVILSQHHLFSPSGDDFEGKFTLKYCSGFDMSFASCHPQAHPSAWTGHVS